ncbi:unnamed protein product [Symbiodinium sp. CCMP2592]|nr:unnamed protein product [Symbiodinium sp. CCMP2592]
MIDNIASADTSIGKEMRTAKSSVKDAGGSLPAPLVKLGSYSGANNARDFERSMQLPAEPVMVSTRVKAKVDSTMVVEEKIPVLLPHRVFLYLFNVLGLLIRPEDIDQYWQHQKSFCTWASHNDLDGKHVPVTIYGDTARYGQGYDQSKITGCFMSLPLWRPKSTRMSQWLLFSVDADRSLGPETLNPLYLAIVESLNEAFHGRTPEGWPLPHKFSVTEIKGDWEFHYHTFQLRRYWKTRWVCWRCHAEHHDNAAHSCYDFDDHPAWEATPISSFYFLANIVKRDNI